jgi:hypothetical protein
LDADLNLPERGYSYLLQELSSRLSVTMSYEDTQEIVSSLFPVNMPIRSLERIVGDVCNDVERFCEEKAPPDLCPEAVVTVATVDKKGVVIRKPHASHVVSEIAPVDPDKPGKKKMATVISTYVTERHLRTADEIVGEVTDRSSCDSRPKTHNKIIWGSLTDAPGTTSARLKKAVHQ